MEITRTLYVPDREGWRRWLQEHHRSEPEVWLIYFRKHAGQPRVAYNDAVEEALCFGWIDSTVKTLDADRYAQRFTPRRAGSGYSQPNRERLRRMLAQARVAAEIVPTAESIVAEPFQAPDDILEALRADPEGWAYFQRCSPAYQRIRIAFVDSARERPEDFQKRLRHLLRMNARRNQFGSGIESYY